MDFFIPVPRRNLAINSCFPINSCFFYTFTSLSPYPLNFPFDILQYLSICVSLVKIGLYIYKYHTLLVLIGTSYTTLHSDLIYLFGWHVSFSLRSFYFWFGC